MLRNKNSQDIESLVLDEELKKIEKSINLYVHKNHYNANQRERWVICNVFNVYLLLGLLAKEDLTQKSKISEIISKRCSSILRAHLVEETCQYCMNPDKASSTDNHDIVREIIEDIENLISTEVRIRDSKLLDSLADSELSFV